MSQTLAKLTDDMKQCMKAGDRAKLEVVRMLLADIKNAKINDPKDSTRDRTEEEVVSIVSAYHKTMSKTLTEYPADRQAALKAELAIVEQYLPRRLSHDELQAALATELAATTERNFGLLMKQMQAKFGSQTDGKTLSEALKNVLK